MRSSAVSAGNTATAAQYNALRQDAAGGAFLLPHQQSAPDLTLKVEAGVCYVGATRVIYAGGNSPSFTAPASNPRIDLLTIDSSGTIARTAGTEAASPSVPTYPSDKLVLAEVYCRVGQTALYDTDQGSNGYIKQDVRPILGGSYIANAAQIADGIITDAKLASTDFVKQNCAQIYAADAQASDTYVITLSPAPGSLTTGMLIIFKANTANTGAATLNVNSLGAKTIKKQKDQDLSDNDIKAGQIVQVVYDGTNMQMVSPVSNAAGGGSISRTTSDVTLDSPTINTTETNVISTTLTGGKLGANGLIRFRAYFTYSTANSANPLITFKLYIGTTVIASFSWAQGDTTSRTYTGWLEGEIQAANATNSQRGVFTGMGIVVGTTAATNQHAWISGAGTGTAAEDTTSNKTLKVTGTFSSNNRGTVTIKSAYFELVPVAP